VATGYRKAQRAIELSKAISQTSLPMQAQQHQHNANDGRNGDHLISASVNGAIASNLGHW
jgi:hypothetical protein